MVLLAGVVASLGLVLAGTSSASAAVKSHACPIFGGNDYARISFDIGPPNCYDGNGTIRLDLDGVTTFSSGRYSGFVIFGNGVRGNFAPHRKYPFKCCATIQTLHLDG